MKTWTIVLGILIGAVSLSAQSLIPDSRMDELKENDCGATPIENMALSKYWYTSGGTPYLTIKQCPVPSVNHLYWWYSAGENYITIGGSPAYWGVFGTQGFGTELLSPLEADKKYYLEFQLRNRGEGHWDPARYRSCATDPQKFIQAVIGYDSLVLDVSFGSNYVASSGNSVIKFQDDLILDKNLTSFYLTGNCFVPEGGETHLGFHLPIGPFEIAPPCEIKDTTEIFRHYFYDFDNIQLYELPEQLYDTLYICAEEGGSFDPEKRIDLPRPLPKTFQWLDQSKAGLREFKEPGTYQMDIELLCGVIDFELVVIEKVCTPQVYAPNVFSPNFDGINDDFQLYIESDLPLENYELQVYDRWGNRVFAASDPTQSWDGRYRGQVVPAGVYSWYAKWDLFTPTGKVEEYLESGSLTVLP